MRLKVLMFLSFISYSLAAEELTSEQLAFSKKIAGILQSGNAIEYKKIIHSECPIDEAKIFDVTKTIWTSRYQVRLKTIKESFDPAFIKFKVTPEYALEFQVWTKVTDPARIKMMKGATEIESTKLLPVAKEKSELKILEWPCFNSI